MFAHQCFKQNLIDFVVGTPIITNYVVGNLLNKFLVKVVVSSLVLNVGVSIRNQTFGVVNLHVSVIGPQHIKSQQIDHSFFPRERLRFIQVFYCFGAVVLYSMHATLMRHIPLPSDVGHWLHL